jgi:hypothetical protein
LAVHIVTGVLGAKYDFQLFLESIIAVEELVASYIGNVGTGTMVLVTPHKVLPGLPLGPRERCKNTALSRSRVITENFFSRLQGKFAIMTH